MNHIIIIGRLVNDPDIRVSGDGSTTIARYRIAVNRRYKKDEADFINCVAFNKSAEFAEKYLKKGMKMAIQGSLRCGSYTDRNGNKVYTTDIVVEDQEFAESKAASETTPPAIVPDPRIGGNVPDDGFMDIPDGMDEELPFN